VIKYRPGTTLTLKRPEGPTTSVVAGTEGDMRRVAVPLIGTGEALPCWRTSCPFRAAVEPGAMPLDAPSPQAEIRDPISTDFTVRITHCLRTLFVGLNKSSL